MKAQYFIIGAIVLLIAFLVWVNFPKKKEVNPAWQADYDASINAGYSAAEAAKMASQSYPKYVYTEKQ